MSTHTTTPSDDLDEFRNTFHPDFPYDDTQWRENLVIQSGDGVLFHFTEKILIDNSCVFAGAFGITPSSHELPIPGVGRLESIPSTVASSIALRYFLFILLILPDSVSNSEKQRKSEVQTTRQEPSREIIIEVERIADFLDSPAWVRIMFKRESLNVYERYTIEKMFESTTPQRPAGPRLPARGRIGADLSFSLDIDSRYERCLETLKKYNPQAQDSLRTFYHARKLVIADTLYAWKNPSADLASRASSHKSKRIHDPECLRIIWSKSISDLMKELSPIMMKVLSESKTKSQRTSNILGLLSPPAKGCRGCLNDLRMLYLPALQKFQR